jgi:hypothetical protein
MDFQGNDVLELSRIVAGNRFHRVKSLFKFVLYPNLPKNPEIISRLLKTRSATVNRFLTTSIHFSDKPSLQSRNIPR